VTDVKIEPFSGDDLSGLVAFLRQQGCIAFVGADGHVQVIPPPEVDPDDEAAVAELVEAWERRAA
jgi:hypothetical protein